MIAEIQIDALVGFSLVNLHPGDANRGRLPPGKTGLAVRRVEHSEVPAGRQLLEDRHNLRHSPGTRVGQKAHMLALFYDLEPLPAVRPIVDVTRDVQANIRSVTPHSRKQVSDDG